MKVAVTSENPVKLAAVKGAFSEYFPDETISYITVKTDSGVSDQPMDAAETAIGARNRALNVQNTDADFVIGIEGGLSIVVIDGNEYAFEQTWACVADIRNNLSELASGPAYPLPRAVVAHIKQGKNMTDAMQVEYGTVELGKNDGYNGWLSDNKIDRTESSRIAIFLALCGIMKEEYQHGKK